MCVITTYGVQCLFAGCRGSGAGQQAVSPGRGMLQCSIPLLCPSSGAQDYMCVITIYGVQCLVAGCQGSAAG